MSEFTTERESFVGTRTLVPTERQGGQAPRDRVVLAPESGATPGEPDTTVAPSDESASAWRAALRGTVRTMDPRQIDGPKLPLFVFTAISILGGLGGAVLGIAGPEIQATFGTSITGLVAISSVTGIITLVLGLPLGYLVDRVSRVALIRIGVLLAPLGTLTQTTAPTFGLFTAGQVASELAAIPGDGATDPLLADYYRAGSRAKVYGFMALAGLAGGLIAQPLLGWMITEYGWRRAAFGLTIVGLVVSALTFLLREPARGASDRLDLGMSAEAVAYEPPPPSPMEALRGAWAIRSLRLQAIAGFVGSFSAPLTILLGLVLASKFALSPFERSLLATATTVAVFPAILIGTALADRLLLLKPSAVVALQAAFQFVSSAALVGQAFAPNLAIFFVLSIIPPMMTSTLAPVSSTVASMIVPARLRGIGMQIGTPFALIALLLAPVLTQVATQVSLEGAFIWFAPFMVISGLMFLASAGYVDQDIRNARAAAAAEEVVLDDADDPNGRVLVCREVEVVIGGASIIAGVDLDVYRGELLALTGTNGAGKSTLMKAICGLQPASNGAIFFDGRDITHVPSYELAERGLTYVPGGEGVFPELSVRDNLLAAASGRRTPSADVIDQALEAFPALAERLDVRAGDLSGGEQQMVALAQAFVLGPDLLMIDELSLGLAPSAVESLLQSIVALNATGTTVVFVEQSLNIACRFARRVVYLDEGKVAFDGPSEQLLSTPGIVRARFMNRAGTGRRVRPSAAGDQTPAAVLRVEDLSVSYGGVRALDSVSFDVNSHEVLGILGSNGAGKTTLFDAITGYQPLSTGRVLLGSGDDARDLTQLSPQARAQAGLARAFQNARLFGSLTVRETVGLAQSPATRAEAISSALGLSLAKAARARRAERVASTLESFGLTRYADAFIDELSTGTRRAVELACLSLRSPRVVLLDEPSSGLAQAETEALGPALRRVVRGLDCSMIVIDHDLDLMRGLCDRLVALDRGRVVAVGPTEEVLADAQVMATYLAASDLVLTRSGAAGSGPAPQENADER